MANDAKISLEGSAVGRARLNTSSPVPLYHQIYVILKDQIQRGDAAQGDLVPGEWEISREFGVSRVTAKQALNELAKAGIVTRERGRGTRVLARPPLPGVTASIEGWLENIAQMGATTIAKVLEFDYGPAPADVVAALELAAHDEVQRSIRVRYFQGTPMSHLITYVPADIGRHYDREALNVTSLLHLLEAAGVKVASARQTITARLADPSVAQLLQVDVGSALIEIRRVVRDTDGRPVECVRILYRPDIYEIEMSMRRIQEGDNMRWSALQEGEPRVR